MKIRTLSLLAAILFCANIMAQTAIPGSNLTWKLESATLTIEGTGAMPDYLQASRPWHGSRGTVQTVVIGDGVTSIGNDAFRSFANLKSVSIPNSVISIGTYAFSNCVVLPSVIIPNSVTTIGNYAFDACLKLGSLIIPNSVKTIGDYAFRDCLEVTNLSIGNSVTKIGNSAFRNCALKQVEIKATVPPSLSANVFYGKPSTTVTLYVPCQSVEAYRANNDWKNVFSNIVGSITLFITAESANTTMGSAEVVSVSCNESTAIIAATANTGYVFKQWHDGNTDNPREVSATTDNLFTAEFEVAGSVGINNVVTGGIYSNSNGTFTIDASGGETFDVTVINMQGQVVKRETVRGGNNTINIGNQPAGVYVFVVDNGRQKSTVKVIKN